MAASSRCTHHPPLGGRFLRAADGGFFAGLVGWLRDHWGEGKRMLAPREQQFFFARPRHY
jgi:hypothetical protein